MDEDVYFGDTTTADVDLVVVPDEARAQEICAELLQAGLEHVKCWPEDFLKGEDGQAGGGLWDKLRGTSPAQGPWHIRVWREDLAEAQRMLAESGPQE